MKVDNFSVSFDKNTTIFSADFTFERPPGKKKQRLLFYLSQVFANLQSPIVLWQESLHWKQRIWFSLPNTVAYAAQYEDAFFLLAAGMAMYNSEDLYFASVVSPECIEKLPALKKYFDYGFRKNILIRYHSGKRIHSAKKGEAQFFTLGVDSFFTLLCQPPRESIRRSLVYVDGFDVPLTHTSLLKKIHQRIRSVARKTSTYPVFVQSNLREVADKKIGWGVFHVAALAAVGYLLPYKKLLLAGETFDWPDWGLRTGVDKLFSTSEVSLSLVNHNVPRQKTIQKLLASTHSESFLQNLRVCWQNVTLPDEPYNCGKCQKCLRTKLTLTLSNAISS